MKSIKMLFVVCAVVFLAGCASMYPTGTLFTDIKVPTQMGDGKDISYTKVGQASASSFLSLIAVGDASVEAAVKNGDIRTIKYVDYHVNNVLGLFGTYTTIVYGD